MTTATRHRLLGWLCLPLLAAGCAGDDVSATEGTARPTTTTVDPDWPPEVLDYCNEYSAGLQAIPEPATTSDWPAFIEAHAEVRAEVGSLSDIDLPPELTTDPTDAVALEAATDESLAEAQALAAEGLIDGPPGSATAAGAFDRYLAQLGQATTFAAMAGVSCAGADPARVANASLNVPVLGAFQVTAAFDSVWVSELYGNQIRRIDPESGETAATIELDSTPVKAQPADHRLIVRTSDAYVAVDPTTDEVADALAKADVGPLANRSWAVDGALWICDGSRVHRYDPATLEAMAAIDLDLDCGQVFATPDLVVAWTYNEDDGESGTSKAAFVDPATDTVVGTTDLPFDVGVPVVLDDRVFFPGYLGSRAAVVDRGGWSVIGTRDYVFEMGGSQTAFDGTFIYAIVDKQNVLAIDPLTLQVTATIEPFDWAPGATDVNSVAFGLDALWTVNDGAGLLQRFEPPAT